MELFDAVYPLVWYILKQLFTSVLVKSGAICCWLSTGLVYTKTIIHPSVGEEWNYLVLSIHWFGIY